MPIQLTVWERRDNGNRETMGNSALEICRILRKVNGIASMRFYWSGSENIVFLEEGESTALSAPAIPADQAKKYWQQGFTLADNARVTLNLRLAEPRDAIVSYRTAGRL